MPEVFSVSFQFQHKIYKAMVSLRQEGYDLCCTVHYPDKELHAILPGSQLVFNMAEGLKQPARLGTELSQQLIDCTTKAIADYLQVQETSA